jgi:hypothetical protein
MNKKVFRLEKKKECGLLIEALHFKIRNNNPQARFCSPDGDAVELRKYIKNLKEGETVYLIFETENQKKANRK